VRKIIPARLHVIFARDVESAVVFRRGPSKQVCTYLWDRKDDTFKLGQWLKGRIYERRSDLSPNGKYMIYFAMNGKWDSETKGAWTTISKVPWLKAIELYTKGDCWEGGGLFLSENKFWLNDRHFDENSKFISSEEVTRDDSYTPNEEFGTGDTGVYYNRLIRDGWNLTSREEYAKWNTATLFEKPLINNWILKKKAHEQVGAAEGKSCYWDEHELLNTSSKKVILCPDWEWAELDKYFIVWASKGCLYRSTLHNEDILKNAKILYDFNRCKFQSPIRTIEIYPHLIHHTIKPLTKYINSCYNTV